MGTREEHPDPVFTAEELATIHDWLQTALEDVEEREGDEDPTSYIPIISAMRKIEKRIIFDRQWHADAYIDRLRLCGWEVELPNPYKIPEVVPNS